MKQLKYILFSFLIIFLSIISVNAQCTNEELLAEKEKAENIKITYKHLGEVTKDDGSKVYNEFLVTTKNLAEGQYIYLSPLANEDFVEKDNTIQITLTTGKWEYNIYSSKCKEIVKTINVNLPKFNMYSIDPLCKDIDGDDFTLCSKYLEYEVSRETFERKINEYRKTHTINNKDNNKEENININYIINKALDFINKYNLYIAGFLLVILVILIIIIIKKKLKKRNVLE